MIEALTQSIVALLNYEIDAFFEADGNLSISISPPGSDFPSNDFQLPGLNLFLYDIREDLEVRNSQQPFAIDPSETLPIPTRAIRCSYFITAWSEPSADLVLQEHELLFQAIAALRKHNVIPKTLPPKTGGHPHDGVILQGDLTNLDRLPRTFTLGAAPTQNVGEFWRAMGNKPKPRFNYAVTFDLPLVEEAPTAPLIAQSDLAMAEGVD